MGKAYKPSRRSAPPKSDRCDSYSTRRGEHISKRKNHAPAFKARVALAALSGNKTITELSSEFGVHQTLIHKWVKQLKESAVGIFAGEIKTEEARKEKQLQVLHAKIGQLTVERDFLAEAWGKR